MELTPSTIKPKRIKKNTKRVGRGNGSGKGTYAGRGLKGQKARAGNKGIRARSFKQSLQKIPKLKGFKTLKLKPQTVTLKTLSRLAEQNEIIDLKLLKTKKIIKSIHQGAKIVATGELNKKVTLKGCLVTKKAKEIIEKQGGKIIF